MLLKIVPLAFSDIETGQPSPSRDLPSRDLDMPGFNSIDNVLSTEDQAYKSWLREFNVEEDPVPDAFINALLQRVVCDMHIWNRMGRGRRLQEQLDRRAGLAGTTTAVPARAEQT